MFLVRNLLRSKGISVPIGCAMCNSDIEHLLHLFFDCRFAQECWQSVGLLFDTMAIESAPEWLLQKLSDDTEDSLIKISAVLWGIWFARNNKIFEGKNITPAAVVRWSRSQIEEWRAVNRKKLRNQNRLMIDQQLYKDKWSRPGIGKFKVNVDAAVKHNQNYYAVGMVLRDHEGRYITGKAVRFRTLCRWWKLR